MTPAEAEAITLLAEWLATTPRTDLHDRTEAFLELWRARTAAETFMEAFEANYPGLRRP